MADELVTLTTFEFPAKAELAKAILEQQGLTVFLADDNLVTANWLLGNAVGYVKLQVATSQADAARQILTDHPGLLDDAPTTRDRAESEPADGRETTTKCLSCGAAIPPGVDRCASCGWSYADPADQSETE